MRGDLGALILLLDGGARSRLPAVRSPPEQGTREPSLVTSSTRPCLGCHIGAAQGGLALEDGHSALVGVQSSIGVNLVTAGDLDESYLWHKLSHTHLDVGGTGEQMPQSGAITAGELDTIEAWIVSGAAP